MLPKTASETSSNIWESVIVILQSMANIHWWNAQLLNTNQPCNRKPPMDKFEICLGDGNSCCNREKYNWWQAWKGEIKRLRGRKPPRAHLHNQKHLWNWNCIFSKRYLGPIDNAHSFWIRTHRVTENHIQKYNVWSGISRSPRHTYASRILFIPGDCLFLVAPQH